MHKFYGDNTGGPESEACAKCTFRDTCVGAGKLANDLKGVRSNHNQKHAYPYASMFGEINHERLAELRDLKTSPKEIIESIEMGKDIVFSAFICSPTYGLRGTPDAVVVKHEKGETTYTIIEDKSKYHAEDLKQALAYAIILTAPDAQMVMEDSKTARLHNSEKGNYKVNVFLNFYNLDPEELKELKRDSYMEVSKNGRFNPKILEEINATLTKADRISESTARSKLAITL